MGYFKNVAIELEDFEQLPAPKRLADIGVEPMPCYDRPRVLRALGALEWARIASPAVSRKGQAMFLVQSLVDQGATLADFDALIAYGWSVEELGDASQALGVEF